MSLNFLQMQHLLNEIKPLLEGALCEEVITVNPFAFILKFKQRGLSYFLMISLKERFFRFHLIDEAMVNRKFSGHAHPFFRALAKSLINQSLVDFSLLNDDRILALSFMKGEKIVRLVAEFLPRRPNGYLMDGFQQIHASLNPVDHRIYDLPEQVQERHDSVAHVKEPLNLLDSKAVAKIYAENEKEHNFSSRKAEVEADLKKQIQRAVRRIEQGKLRLQECLNFEVLHHNATLLQSNLFQIKQGMKEVIVTDWDQNNETKKIELDPLIAPHAQISLFFKKSKKLKAGIPHAERQLLIAEQDVQNLYELQKKIVDVKTIGELDSFFSSNQNVRLNPKEKTPKEKPKPAKPYHVFKSATGKEIWVGKSAKDNDKLSFQCAHGLDFWLHARDFPGSHVVVPVRGEKDLDEETLADASELALRFSKAKGQSVGEVSLTNVKGIVSVKGCPGKVMLSKYKTVRLKLDDKRFERLRKSKES